MGDCGQAEISGNMACRLARARPILDHVRGWIEAGILVLAAVTRAAAADSSYVIHVPEGSRVEAPAITRFGNWEVTVSYDPALCVISCAYRLRSDRFGLTPTTDFLLPPPITVHVFPGGAAAPGAVIIDPAGMGRPALCRQPGIDRGDPLVPGKRLFCGPPEAQSELAAVAPFHPVSPSATLHEQQPAPLPLRV